MEHPAESFSRAERESQGGYKTIPSLVLVSEQLPFMEIIRSELKPIIMIRIVVSLLLRRIEVS